ncbi:MAG TPA: alpha/beta hydrolase [Nitrososphaeraceae archaeon]
MYYTKKSRESQLHPLISSVTFLFVLIGSTSIIVTNTPLVYSQTNQTITNADLLNIQDIPAKKVKVGDIDIAYKILGKGDPILLVSPAQADMNAWEPSTLKELSSNHTVIVFDNRGVGNTTTGNKSFSIQQFANDTAGLLDALDIEKADVLGFSLGSLAALDLTVTHPEMVNRLILVAASCGGKESIPPSPQVLKMGIDIANKSANDIPITPQEVKALLALTLGSGWIKLHPNYLETIPIPEVKDLFPSITPNNNLQQLKAYQSWVATNWSGICNELTKISIPTLVITGTDDNSVPKSNSLIIAGKIPGAWLIQIKDAGHTVISQYPDEVNKVLQIFLSTTSTPPS